MDFYIMELDQQNKLVRQIKLPLNPQAITIQTGAMTEDYSIINVGDIRIPKGNKLDSVSWEGKLPGEHLKTMPYIKDWRDPKGLYNLLLDYKKRGQKLRLMVTETPILLDVYIEEFTGTIAGGTGDIDYNIALIEAKDLIVYTTAEGKGSVSTTAIRPQPSGTKTYTVKSGDSLWKIAQALLGKGARYPEIQSLNSIKDPNKIYVGQVLKIPNA